MVSFQQTEVNIGLVQASFCLSTDRQGPREGTQMLVRQVARWAWFPFEPNRYTPFRFQETPKGKALLADLWRGSEKKTPKGKATDFAGVRAEKKRTGHDRPIGRQTPPDAWPSARCLVGPSQRLPWLKRLMCVLFSFLFYGTPYLLKNRINEERDLKEQVCCFVFFHGTKPQNCFGFPFGVPSISLPKRGTLQNRARPSNLLRFRFEGGSTLEHPLKQRLKGPTLNTCPTLISPPNEPAISFPGSNLSSQSLVTSSQQGVSRETCPSKRNIPEAPD